MDNFFNTLLMEEEEEGERGRGVTRVAAQHLMASRHLRYILAKHKTQENLWYNEQSQFSVQFQYC